MTGRILFKDGVDASTAVERSPWEVGTDNEPVFVEEFIDWEGKPFLLATDGSLFRMRPNNGANSRYSLESAEGKGIAASILSYGSEITEEAAVALL